MGYRKPGMEPTETERSVRKTFVKKFFFKFFQFRFKIKTRKTLKYGTYSIPFFSRQAKTRNGTNKSMSFRHSVVNCSVSAF
jgi:hypothetical protein